MELEGEEESLLNPHRNSATRRGKVAVVEGWGGSRRWPSNHEDYEKKIEYPQNGLVRRGEVEGLSRGGNEGDGEVKFRKFGSGRAETPSYVLPYSLVLSLLEKRGGIKR